MLHGKPTHAFRRSPNIPNVIIDRMAEAPVLLSVALLWSVVGEFELLNAVAGMGSRW